MFNELFAFAFVSFLSQFGGDENFVKFSSEAKNRKIEKSKIQSLGSKLQINFFLFFGDEATKVPPTLLPSRCVSAKHIGFVFAQFELGSIVCEAPAAFLLLFYSLISNGAPPPLLVI